MQLNVSAALKQPAKVFEAVIEKELPEQSFAGRRVAFLAPARLSFNYSYDGDAFALKGTASFLISTSCARCDEKLEKKLEVDFEERFVKHEEEEAYTFVGDTLLLDEMTLGILFLHLPMQSVCKDDCLGLCPICGCNLNTARCDCEPQLRLNPLSTLLYDDKEV